MGPRLLNLLPPWETSFFYKVNKFHVFECFKQLLVKCTHVWKKVQKCASVDSHISDTWPKFTLCISSIGFLMTPSVHVLVFCWPLQYMYWFFVDPFSTKINFSTEGVKKKTNTVLVFLLTPLVLKLHLSIKKFEVFTWQQCDYGRSGEDVSVNTVFIPRN